MYIQTTGPQIRLCELGYTWMVVGWEPRWEFEKSASWIKLPALGSRLQVGVGSGYMLVVTHYYYCYCYCCRRRRGHHHYYYHAQFLCEHCDTWYHISCQAMPSANYSQLDHLSLLWTCVACNSNNYSTTSPAILHDDDVSELSDKTSIDSIDYNHQPLHESSPTKYKPTPAKHGRSLRQISVNCQSLPGRKGA